MALYYYIKALGNKNYRHYVYCLKEGGPVKDKIENLNAKITIGLYRESIKKPIKFIITSTKLILDIMNFASTNQIHILHSHSGQANQIGVLVGLLKRIPSFPTVHSTMAFNEPKERKINIINMLKKVVNSFIYRISYRVVCVSDRIKNIVVREFRIKERKIIVLKNGVVIDKTKRIKRIQKNRKIIKLVCVGRLVGSKGFDLAIVAISKILKEKNYKLKLSIAGDGEEKKRLSELIRKHRLEKIVFLLGERMDVDSLLEESDIFILPSKFEGLSIAMIEAMGCGLPIIASDSPGINDFIIDGKNGLLFKKNNIDDLKEKICQIIENVKLRLILSNESRSTFNNEYNMKKNIKPLEKCFTNY